MPRSERPASNRAHPQILARNRTRQECGLAASGRKKGMKAKDLLAHQLGETGLT